MTPTKVRVPRVRRATNHTKRNKTIFTLLLVGFGVALIAIVWELKSTKEIEEEPVTDLNGDPATPPFSAQRPIVTPRPPRPPERQIHFEDKPDTMEAPSQPRKQISNYWQQISEVNGAKIDWHDYKAMAEDLKREGPGEHGEPAFITDESLKDLEKELSMDNGFNALLSDQISVNRSMPEVRKDGCRSLKYLADLPTTSVVIPFYNEYFSVLVRTLHSIVNRTPPQLLQEIIIVDDFSDRENLKAELDDYLEKNFKGLVRVIRLPQRTGLIGARLAGAKEAVGEVLVFFDSHIECNYNWLPPLLEPIAINPNISTCPIVDVIMHDDFSYEAHQQDGRGAFDWNLDYKQLPLRPGDTDVEGIRPYQNPIMMGGLFAISQEFFWTLGGYDEGLDIWGGEQYELSFKIWMCGGVLLDVPCSRVAHIFRGPMNNRPSPRNYSFVARNFMRVAEVWMDDYKNYVYGSNPETFEDVDPGDLAEQHSLRQILQCKPFQWFLDEVAPDLLERYPPVPPPNYAWGTIQSKAFPSHCVDAMSRGAEKPIGMFNCAANRTHPQSNQNWWYTLKNEIKFPRDDLCWDVSETEPNAKVIMWKCHQQEGNQYWFYDRQKQWLVHGLPGSRCLEAVRRRNGNLEAVVNACDSSNENMKWVFGYVNETMMNNFVVDLEQYS